MCSCRNLIESGITCLIIDCGAAVLQGEGEGRHDGDAITIHIEYFFLNVDASQRCRAATAGLWCDGTGTGAATGSNEFLSIDEGDVRAACISVDSDGVRGAARTLPSGWQIFRDHMQTDGNIVEARIAR